MATPEEAVMRELMGRGHALGQVQMKSDGCLTFDYFMQTMKIVIEYTIKHTHQGLLEIQTQRRKALKDDNMSEFKDLVYKASNWEQLTTRVIQGNLYQSLRVEPAAFAKSQN